MDDAWARAFEDGILMNGPPDDDPFALAWIAEADEAHAHAADPDPDDGCASSAKGSAEPEEEEVDEECNEGSQEEEIDDRPAPKERRSKRQRKEKQQTTENAVDLGDRAELFVVHISDVLPSADGEVLVTLTSGPPTGWTSYQTVRRVAAWLSLHGGVALETTSVYVGNKRFRVCTLQTPLLQRHAVYEATHPPRLADVFFIPTDANWLAMDSHDITLSWGSLPADDGTGYGGYWRQRTRPACSSWTVLLEGVKEPAALFSSMLLLSQLPSECRVLPSGACVVCPVAAVPVLDGTAALRDGGFWTRAALIHWATPLITGRVTPDTSQFRRVWNVLRLEDTQSLPWSHALLLCTGLMRQLRARCVVRSRNHCHRLLRMVVMAVSSETGRRGLAAVTRRIRDGVPLSLALRTDNSAISRMCYQVLVVTLSPLLPGDRLSEVLKGVTLESTLTDILLSRDVPSVAQFASFGPAALLNAFNRVSVGLSTDKQRSFLCNDTRVLPAPHALVPNCRMWLDLLICARAMLCQSYALRDTPSGIWPWEASVFYNDDDLAHRGDSNPVLWASGHEVLGVPHSLMFPALATESERRITAVSLTYTADVDTAERTAHWRISTDLTWDGSNSAAGAVLDALLNLAETEEEEAAPVVHLVLGGAECPLHFAQHFTRQMSMRLYNARWGEDGEHAATCPTHVQIPAGEWLANTAVYIHSCMNPAVALLMRDPAEPWLVLHAYQAPPLTMRWLAMGSTRARRVRVDAGSPSTRPPPEFRWRRELAPWLRPVYAAAKAPPGAAAEPLDESYEPGEVTRWSAWCASVGATGQPRLFARQPNSAALRALPPFNHAVHRKVRWADLVVWPRVLYKGCRYLSPSGHASVVLDPELTERERRWLGSASWISAPGNAPEAAAAERTLWVSGDATVASAYPWLPRAQRADGSFLLAVWHPLVSRLTV